MESMREILGGQKMQIIEQLTEDLRRVERIIDDLLCLTGRPGICFSCARPVIRIEPADKSLTEQAGIDERTDGAERSVNSKGSVPAPLIHLFNYNGEPHHCSFPMEVPHE